MKGLLKKWFLTWKQFENIKPKNPKNPVIVCRTKHKNHETPMAKTEHEPWSQEEINWSKIKKSIQNKTVRTLQD